MALNTAGMQLKYKAVLHGASMPTTGYASIGGITSLPEINDEPNNLECTTLGETDYKQYVPGLRDVAGTLGFGCNDDNDFDTAWATVVGAYDNGASDVYFEFYHPKKDKSFYIMGQPVELGFGGAEVDNVFTNTAYISPNKILGWKAKSN